MRGTVFIFSFSLRLNSASVVKCIFWNYLLVKNSPTTFFEMFDSQTAPTDLSTTDDLQLFLFY